MKRLELIVPDEPFLAKDHAIILAEDNDGKEIRIEFPKQFVLGNKIENEYDAEMAIKIAKFISTILRYDGIGIMRLIKRYASINTLDAADNEAIKSMFILLHGLIEEIE
jgi:hypothetical protein